MLSSFLLGTYAKFSIQLDGCSKSSILVIPSHLGDVAPHKASRTVIVAKRHRRSGATLSNVGSPNRPAASLRDANSVSLNRFRFHVIPWVRVYQSNQPRLGWVSSCLARVILYPSASNLSSKIQEIFSIFISSMSIGRGAGNA